MTLLDLNSLPPHQAAGIRVALLERMRVHPSQIKYWRDRADKLRAEHKRADLHLGKGAE